MSRLIAMRAGLLAACGFALAFALPSTLGQDRKPVVPFEGTQAFRHILQFFKLEPVRNLDQLVGLPPEETVVILFGRLDVLDELGDRRWSLSTFLKAGGSALIASDYADEGRLADFAVDVKGSPVLAPADRPFKGSRECPIISPKEFTDPAHPIFRNVKTGIATNRPSYLGWEETPRLTRLATFPKRSISGVLPIPLSPFAVGSPANTEPRGRVLVLAGHGLFLNGMMAQSEVDNFSFAWSCVSWLGEKEKGLRKYALFVENGKVSTDFNIPLAELPPIPIPPTRVINAVLRGMEEEDLFNRVLHESVGREEILQGVMIMLSVGLVFVAGLGLLKARYRLDTRAPLVAPSLERALSDVPVLSQRHRALLLQGNLFEAAQVLAQLWFEKHVPDEKLAERLPNTRIAGNWWQRWKLGRQVRIFWDIAYGPAREISRSEFQRLMDSVERLTVAYDRGVLRFEPLAAALSRVRG